ncbi:MAG: response regulator, partial [Desulfobacteraceae bacterium]|nr:response regulator [Desulfobacteraceae bacterium]
MAKPPHNKVLLTLIKEVKDFLPEIEKLISLLKAGDNDNKQITIELNDIMSTIMGVSTMMNLDTLTNTSGLINRVLDNIIDEKLVWNQQLIKVVSETVQQINTFCSAFEARKDLDDTLFQNALSGLGEFEKVSVDNSDNLEDEFEIDFSDDIEISDDADEFSENLDMNIIDEVDVPSDMPLETADSELLDIDPEFLESFNEESKDHLNNINQELNLLSPSINEKIDINDEYQERLHSIRRSVHTLKGAAAVIGIKSVASFGNEFEDFLDWLHDESDSIDPKIITAMFDGTDILEKLSVNPAIIIDKEIDAIVSRFKNILADLSKDIADKKQIKAAGADNKQIVEPEIDPESIVQPKKIEQVKTSKVIHKKDENISDSETTDIDPEFLNSFNKESRNHLNNIDQKLNQMSPINEKIDINDEYREMLHSIGCSVHAVRGAAAVVGIESIANFGNELEDFLELLHNKSDTIDPKIMSAMLDGAKILETLLVNPTSKIDKKIKAINTRFKNILADLPEDIVDKEQSQTDDADNEQNIEPEIDHEVIAQPKEIELDKTSTVTLEKIDIDPEFLESFNEESKDHLDNIDQKLNLLSPFIKEKTDIFDGYREILHSIRRSVHTLKGAAAVIGIKSVASFGNEFEDFLDWLHDESSTIDPTIITIMFDGTDILEKLSVNPAIEIDEKIDEIKSRFENILTDSSKDIVDKEQSQTDDADNEQNIEPEIVHEPIVQPEEPEEPEKIEEEIEEIEQIKSPTTLDEIDDNSESLDEFLEDIDIDIFGGDDTFPERIPKIDSSKTTDPVSSDIDPEFLESFNEESKDHLNNLGQKLNLLAPFINEKTDINDEYREILHSIRRSVHTLKGAAAVIGIESVASFGNEFEDFLDWLHDESDTIDPNIITIMFDGTDILEKLSVNPAIKIDEKIDEIKSRFKSILADLPETIFETEPEPKPEPKPEPEPEPEPIITDEELNKLLVPPIDKAVDQPPAKPKAKKAKKVKSSKTIRVDIGKVDQMIGLIGDMTINLSSHEDSSQFFQTTLNEFDNTMNRLKDIALNLETGFELAEIPHLSPVTGSIQKDGQAIDEFDPLEMDRYSDLHIMIRSLNEAVADLNSIMDQTLKVQNLWQSTMGRQRRVINEIQDSMQIIKMTPFSTLSNRLHKTVRESARVTKKSVQLIIEGDYMEMDTHVWDVLADPLMHLLRNSVDHGIESPEQRKKLKKSKLATINIKCIRRGSWINMHFSDDGKGLDYDAIRKKASKLYPKEDIASMDNDELTSMIFKHGFTIKTKATTISGRGVGMDVVNHAVKQLNGNINVLSKAGKGIEFILRLPIEVAQLPALLVKFGQQDFAVPLRDITRVFKINRKQSAKDDFELDNTTMPLLRPTEIMRLKPMSQPIEKNPFAISVDVGGANGVLVTDAILGKKDIVFKNLGSHLHNQVPCIAGATIMGNGSLIPILNTEELFSLEKSSVNLAKEASLKADSDEKVLQILIVDDSISIRKVLSNFISNHGWQPSAAKDGVDAMEMIRQHSFDLILLDIEMPRMNGFDVLQSLQLHLDYSNIPVLMLTSRSAKKYKTKATELGAKGFVT